MQKCEGQMNFSRRRMDVEDDEAVEAFRIALLARVVEIRQAIDFWVILARMSLLAPERRKMRSE